MIEQENKRCCKKSRPTYRVTFDGSNVGNDTWLLCNHHFNKPPFDQFILKIEELK